MSLKHIILLTTACMLCGANANADAVTICLNPGNNALNNPCTSDSANSITLKAATRAKIMLETAGYTVKLARTDNSNPSQSSRISACSGSDLVISIKMNSFSALAKGVDVFYNSKGEMLGSNLATWFYNTMEIGKHSMAKAETKHDDVVPNVSYAGAVVYMTFIERCEEVRKIVGNNYNDTAKAICKAAVQTKGGKLEACTIPGILAGRVTDANGNGLSGASVKIENLGSFIKVSADANGYWKQDKLIPGAHQVQFEATGYHSNTVSCSVVSDDTRSCDVKLTADSGALDITLKDPNNNSKITECSSITAGTDPVTASGSGSWTYTNSPGSYTIAAKCKGYSLTKVSCQITAGITTSCPVELIKAKGSLRGKVSCNNIGAAAAITITGPSYSKTINTIDGEWGLEDLSPGQYEISAVPDDASECKKSTNSCAVVAEEENPNCNISLSEQDKYRINISAEGYNGEIDVPISNAVIDITSTDKQLTFSTNDKGKYSGLFRDGVYKVRVSSPLFKSDTETQECKLIPDSNNANPSCDLEFKLKPIERILCISIYDKKTHLNVGGKVSFKDGPSIPNDITIAVDTIECTGEIPVGTYELEVKSEGEQDVNSKHSVLMPVGESKFNYLIGIDSKKYQTTTLSGNVYSTEGTGNCVEATIGIELDSDSQKAYIAEHKCDNGIKWSIPEIPEGAYKVTATPSDTHFLPNTVGCFTDGEDCNITLQYIADSPDVSGESDNIMSKLPEIDAGSTGDCSMSQTPAHGHLWILLLNLMGLGLIARRSRRAHNTHHR